MAIILHPDGRQEPVEPKNGSDFQLEELQAIVGGYIEIVPAKQRGLILVIDEEGKLKNKKFNMKATLAAGFLIKGLFADIIVGTALLCKNKEVQ